MRKGAEACCGPFRVGGPAAIADLDDDLVVRTEMLQQEWLEVTIVTPPLRQGTGERAWGEGVER